MRNCRTRLRARCRGTSGRALLLFDAFLLFPLLLLAFSLLLLLLIRLPKHHLRRDAQSKRKHQHGGCLTDLPKCGSDYRRKDGVIRQTFVHSCCLHSAESPSPRTRDPGAETTAGVALPTTL